MKMLKETATQQKRRLEKKKQYRQEKSQMEDEESKFARLNKGRENRTTPTTFSRRSCKWSLMKPQNRVKLVLGTIESWGTQRQARI